MLAALRRRAAEAVRAVYGYLGLADFGADHVDLVVDAAGSKDLGPGDPLAVLGAAQIIQSAGITAHRRGRALYETGFDVEAQRLLDMLLARVSGDYLQTAAIFDRDMRVLSAVTDPNDYAGPGTGIPAHVPSGRPRSTGSASSGTCRSCAPSSSGAPASGWFRAAPRCRAPTRGTW